MKTRFFINLTSKELAAEVETAVEATEGFYPVEITLRNITLSYDRESGEFFVECDGLYRKVPDFLTKAGLKVKRIELTVVRAMSGFGAYDGMYTGTDAYNRLSGQAVTEADFTSSPTDVQTVTVTGPATMHAAAIEYLGRILSRTETPDEPWSVIASRPPAESPEAPEASVGLSQEEVDELRTLAVLVNELGRSGQLRDPAKNREFWSGLDRLQEILMPTATD